LPRRWRPCSRPRAGCCRRYGNCWPISLRSSPEPFRASRSLDTGKARPADSTDIFDGWRPDLRDICVLIHSWASSKDWKRNRPRGASPRLPRKAQAVRSSASASPGDAAPSRRRPTVLEGSRSI
jgi:hypothetical protein